jgi:hypothetical protein
VAVVPVGGERRFSLVGLLRVDAQRWSVGQHAMYQKRRILPTVSGILQASFQAEMSCQQISRGMNSGMNMHLVVGRVGDIPLAFTRVSAGITTLQGTCTVLDVQ